MGLCEPGARHTSKVASPTDRPADQTPELMGMDLYLALERLTHRERSVTARWEKLYEYVASFPNAVLEREEREAHEERLQVRRQIRALRKQLGLTGDES